MSNLGKHFGGITAVDGVSFEVHEGEILGIIGPNGSGKSTLFNCVLGQLPPSQGEVRFDGRVTTGMRPCDINRLGVSRTFQLLQVFPQLRCATISSSPGRNIKGSMYSRLVGRRDAGLAGDAGQMIEFFPPVASGRRTGRGAELRPAKAARCRHGLHGRAAAGFARRAGRRRKLTMLVNLRERLQAYHAERKATFVVIEHQMEFVMALCTRVLVLAEGRLIARARRRTSAATQCDRSVSRALNRST